jgi:hypothetical protein
VESGSSTCGARQQANNRPSPACWRTGWQRTWSSCPRKPFTQTDVLWYWIRHRWLRVQCKRRVTIGERCCPYMARGGQHKDVKFHETLLEGGLTSTALRNSLKLLKIMGSRARPTRLKLVSYFRKNHENSNSSVVPSNEGSPLTDGTPTLAQNRNSFKSGNISRDKCSADAYRSSSSSVATVRSNQRDEENELPVFALTSVIAGLPTFQVLDKVPAWTRFPPLSFGVFRSWSESS